MSTSSTSSRHPTRSVVLRLLAGLLVIAGCGASSSRSADRGEATVVRVVDGDTVEVEVAGRTESVRLLGIDTPESVRPGTPTECFAPEAGDRAEALLPPGTEVRLVRDKEARDHFGRLLAYVYRARDDTFVNLEMVRSGHAGVLVLEPNVAHAPRLRAAEAEARGAEQGLWGACGGVHRPAARSP